MKMVTMKSEETEVKSKRSMTKGFRVGSEGTEDVVFGVIFVKSG